LKDSCRDIFRDILYSIRDKEIDSAQQADLMGIAGAATDRSEGPPNPKGIEIEVMKIADLIYKIDE